MLTTPQLLVEMVFITQLLELQLDMEEEVVAVTDLLATLV